MEVGEMGLPGLNGGREDRPRPLPAGVAVWDEPTKEAGVPVGLTFSFTAKREVERRLPPPPGLPPCFTSLKACAPKLILLANDGEPGGFNGAVGESLSSSTAGS